MKKILYIAVASMMFACGCVGATQKRCETYKPHTRQVSNDFNSENYVWEELHFSTNQVDQIRR